MINYDFLSSKFSLKINWLPSPDRPGFVDFFVSQARSVTFAFAVFGFAYLIHYKGMVKHPFSNMEAILSAFVLVFFEEQSRWIFSSEASNLKRACILFLICMVVMETGLYWLVSSGVSSFDFIKIRASSVVVHSINSWLCYRSMGRKISEKYAIFLVAVIFHVFANIYLIGVVGGYLLDL